MIDERNILRLTPSFLIFNDQTHPKKTVEKKPKPADSTLPTRPTEPSSGLYSQLTTENPSLSQDNVVWSSSFSAPAQSFEADSSQSTWTENGLDTLNMKPSNTFLFQPPPLSFNEHQNEFDVQETGTTNGMCLQQLSGTSDHILSNKNGGTEDLKVDASSSFSPLSHPVTDGLWVANTTPQFDIVTDSSLSPSDLNLTTNSPSPSKLTTNSHFVSQSYPKISPLSSSNPSQLDRAQSLPSPIKSSDIDTQTEAAVRSPKRKHSATSINSVDSFFLENQEQGPSSVVEAAAPGGFDYEENHQDELISFSPRDLSGNKSMEEKLTLSMPQPSLNSNVVLPVSNSEKDAGNLILPQIDNSPIKQNVLDSESLPVGMEPSNIGQSHESCC